MNVLSYMVAVLATLVTALIGWQVWNIWKFKDQIKDLKNGIKSQYEESSKKAGNDAIGFCLVQYGVMMYDKGDYSGAFAMLFNGLANLQEGSLSEDMQVATNNAEEHLCQMAEMGLEITIRKEELELCIKAAGRVKDVDRRSKLLLFAGRLLCCD